MSLTITIPESLETRLEEWASSKGMSVPDFTVQLLNDALNDALNGGPSSPSLEDIVAGIQATPPKPANIRGATGSLADALRGCQDEPELDLAEWNRACAAVESEMKALTNANDVAEGRGSRSWRTTFSIPITPLHSSLSVIP